MKGIRKTISKMLVIMLLFSVFVGISPAQAGAAGLSTISVQVDWDNVQSTASDISYSLNGFNVFNPNVAGDPVYNEHLAYMKPGMLRFHSWEMLNNTQSANENERKNAWLNYETQTWDPEKVDRVLSGLKANNPEIMINIPGWPDWMDMDNNGILDTEFEDDFIQLCADLVRIVNIEYGHNVRYWEATNERDGKYYVEPLNASQPEHLDELIDLYNKCAIAMKAVDPGIKVGGPAFMRPDLIEQVNRFIDGTITYTNPTTLDFLSYHFYASGDMGESDKTIYDRVIDLEDNTRLLREALDQKSPDRYIPLWLDECNISWVWTNNDPRMHNEKGAVYDALSMIFAMRGGADSTMAWNEYDGVYGKMYGEDYEFNPNAHTFQLMNNYMVGNVVQAASDDESKVVAFAVTEKKTGDKSYMLINRTNDVQLVDTEFKGRMPADISAKLHQIDAGGYSYKSVNWSDVLEDTYALPPNSVTLVTESRTNPSILPETEEIDVTDMVWYDTSKAMKYQDTDGNWPNQFAYYGGSWINLYGGNGAWNNNPDDYAIFTFYGKQIIFYGQLANDGGIGAISIDDGEETMIDFYAPQTADYGAVYTSPLLPMGVHELKIKATGEKNPDSADSYIGIQGVDVVSDGKPFPSIPQSCNDNNWGSDYNQFNYSGTWDMELNKPHAYGNDLNYSSTAGDYYTVKFYGTGIQWFSRKNSDYGIVDVYIDDELLHTVDLYSAESEMSSMLFSATDLTYGEHVLKVVNTGEKNEASSDTKVIADRVDILPYGSMPPPSASGGGMPDGAFISGAVSAFPSSVDLVEEGTLDWVFWGNEGGPIRKAGTGMISDLTEVVKEGSTGLNILVTDETDNKSATVSWSSGTLYNGSPVEDGSSVKALGMFGDPNSDPNTDEGRNYNESHRNEGVQFTVTADTNARTLKIFGGVIGAKMKIYAHLSDDSAPDPEPFVINSDGGTTSNTVTINYRAASEGQTMTVQCLLDWDHWGNEVWVQAATLYDADMEAPTQPGELSLLSADTTSIALDWDASADNIGVAGYDIYINGKVKVASTKGETSCFIKGLEPDTTYDFTVIAKDDVGNQSVASETLSVTTAEDTTSPTTPDVKLEGIDKNSVTLSWVSVDNVGIVSYHIYCNGRKVSSTASTTFTDLWLKKKGRIYNYRIIAVDAQGNESNAGKLKVKTK